MTDRAALVRGRDTPNGTREDVTVMVEAPVQETATELAFHLNDLWSDERCCWRIEFEPSSYGRSEEGYWNLNLEWTQEGGSSHHADWTTYNWQFYALASEGGPDDVLRQAVEWCEALLPFARCDACGGDGEYGKAGERVCCDECEGTGLANRG